MTDENKDSTSNPVRALGVWLTFAGVVVTGCITGYNVWQTAQIQERQNQLADKQISNGFIIDSIKNELTKRDQDLGRLKFVKELLPDAMSPDATRRATFLTLVQLTLTDAEYRSLVASFSTSSNPQLQEVGKSGQEAIAQTDQLAAAEILRLVDAIKSPDTATRLKAMDTLYKKYATDTRLTRAVIDYLGSSTEPLHIQGRINALFLLINADNAAWTPELIGSAGTAMDIAETAGKGAKGPPIGAQTATAFSRARARLASLSGAE